MTSNLNNWNMIQESSKQTPFETYLSYQTNLPNLPNLPNEAPSVWSLSGSMKNKRRTPKIEMTSQIRRRILSPCSGSTEASRPVVDFPSRLEVTEESRRELVRKGLITVTQAAIVTESRVLSLLWRYRTKRHIDHPLPRGFAMEMLTSFSLPQSVVLLQGRHQV